MITVERTADGVRLCRNQEEFVVTRDEIPRLLRALRTVELAGVLEDWDAMVTAMGHPDARQEAL